MSAGGDVKADLFGSSGSFDIHGDIRSDQVNIVLGGDSSAQSIRAKKISVKRGAKRRTILGISLGTRPASATLSTDSIEGDEVYLEGVDSKTVRGGRVKIGPRCRIESVEYAESLQIDPNAVVKRHTYTGTGAIPPVEKPTKATRDAEEPTFGPVIERVLYADVGKDCFIDLDTGELFTRPQDFPSEWMAQVKWFREHGVDARTGCLYPVKWSREDGVDAAAGSLHPDPLDMLRGGLSFMDAVVTVDGKDEWKTITPDVLRADPWLTKGGVGHGALLPAPGRVPRGWARRGSLRFRTREGGIGVLILAFTDKPIGVKIRYKMIVSRAARGPAPPPRSSTPKPAEKAKKQAWGEAVEGLRCRWVGRTEPVAAGSAPRIAMQVENVSSEVMFWQARSGVTWHIPLRGSRSGRSGILPKFEVRPGRGCRSVPLKEARSHRQGSGDAIGYFRLERAGRLTMVTEYAWILDKPGQVTIAGYVNRRAPGGGVRFSVAHDGEFPADPNRVTCPPLVLQVVPGSPDAAHAYDTVWSEPVDGLQAGITYGFGKRPSAYSRWTALSFRMRNVSDKSITLWYCPTAYDEEPGPVVLDKAGRKQRVEVVSDGRKDPLIKHTLKPGDLLGGGSAGFVAQPRGYTGTKTAGPILYAEPGKYTLTHTFRYNLDGSDRPNKQITVGSVEITILPSTDAQPAVQPSGSARDSAWGEGTYGLRIRLVSPAGEGAGGRA